MLSEQRLRTSDRVQSIATQAAGGEASFTSFLQSFTGRLQGMAQRHILLAESRWGGVGLHDVLRADLAAAGRGELASSAADP